MRWVCVGYGRSLTESDIAFVSELRERGICKIMAANAAVFLFEAVDAMVASDRVFFFRSFKEGKTEWLRTKCYSAASDVDEMFGVNKLVITGVEGFSVIPGHVKSGRTSGYQAIQVAHHLGATQIALLGYDMTGGDYKPTSHGPPAPFEPKIKYYDRLKQESPVEIVNCSRNTALYQFKRMTIDEWAKTA
jgi:hypothetical protein